MFGLGARRKADDEARRLQALTQELQQAQDTLREATERAEKAEAQAAFLGSQNRALAAKVHRLALQRVELLNDKERVEKENKELHISNLKLDNEARVAKAAQADAWQVTNLKRALRQQAVEHEKKISSLKRRTKALLSAILPGGHVKSTGDLPATPESPTAGGELEMDDLWDAPLALTGSSTPDVNSRIRDIVGCLYDDSISEDQALDQMTALTQGLSQKPALAAAGTSRGCSPLPLPKLTADQAGQAAEKVDAATDPQTARPRLVADVSTETPAEMSYIGTPRDMSAAPSQGPASPRRLAAAAVPMLDLAALVAQAMEEAPLSGRSTASTSVSTAAAPSFANLSQFVLAQPEKLQRLILRHAAATSVKHGGPAPAAQSPYGAGLLPGAASRTADMYTVGNSAVGTADPTQLGSASMLTARPSLTSRLFGLGNSNIANRPPTTAPTLQDAAGVSSSTAGAVSASGVTVSPAKAGKRSAAPPKFAKLDGRGKLEGPPQPPPSSQSTGPMLTMPGIKIVSDREVSGNSSSQKLGGGLPFQFASQDGDLKELTWNGNSTSALALFGGREMS